MWQSDWGHMRSRDHFSYLFARKSLQEEREGGDISECLVHLLTAKGGEEGEGPVSRYTKYQCLHKRA